MGGPGSGRRKGGSNSRARKIIDMAKTPVRIGMQTKLKSRFGSNPKEIKSALKIRKRQGENRVKLIKYPKF